MKHPVIGQMYSNVGHCYTMPKRTMVAYYKTGLKACHILIKTIDPPCKVLNVYRFAFSYNIPFKFQFAFSHCYTFSTTILYL